MVIGLIPVQNQIQFFWEDLIVNLILFFKYFEKALNNMKIHIFTWQSALQSNPLQWKFSNISNYIPAKV